MLCNTYQRTFHVSVFCHWYLFEHKIFWAILATNIYLGRHMNTWPFFGDCLHTFEVFLSFGLRCYPLGTLIVIYRKYSNLFPMQMITNFCRFKQLSITKQFISVNITSVPRCCYYRRSERPSYLHHIFRLLSTTAALHPSIKFIICPRLCHQATSSSLHAARFD